MRRSFLHDILMDMSVVELMFAAIRMQCVAMATDSLRHAVVGARLWAISLPLPAAFAASWVALFLTSSSTETEPFACSLQSPACMAAKWRGWACPLSRPWTWLPWIALCAS